MISFVELSLRANNKTNDISSYLQSAPSFLLMKRKLDLVSIMESYTYVCFHIGKLT